MTVTCNGDYHWSLLAQQRGFDPAIELGYVPFFYYPSSGTVAGNADQMFLGPKVCLALQQFGFAAVKPTECQATVTRTTTTYVKMRYRAAVWKRADGKRVRRYAWRTRRIARTLTTSSLEPPANCYLGGGRELAPQDQTYWSTYRTDALGLWTLAHEAIHQQQFLGGASVNSVLPPSETDANCRGLQWIPWVAEQFGATADDAQAIAEYAYEMLYPGYQNLTNNGSPYWSPDCRPGGALDLTPNDNLWP